jgi:DNA-binding response OmpR family regulator
MDSKQKVLIIEDNDDLRESTAEILQLAGFNVYQANNGSLGIQLATAQLPDIILCDIGMPVLDGYETLKLLRQNELTFRIPVIFLSGKTERADFRRGMELGADDYLTKPFEAAELFNAIESRLKKRSQANISSKNILQPQSGYIQQANGLDELEKAAAEQRPQQMSRKQVIYYNGDSVNGIYKVISGKVKTFKVAGDGREILTGVFGPSDYFGIAGFFSGDGFKETAEAMENTVLSMVPKSIVEELVRKYQDVSKYFFDLIAQNVISKDEQLVQVAYHSVRKRMAEVLLRLHSTYNTADLSVLGFSRNTLSEMAGIAMETASRILNDFKNEKLINFTLNNQIVLLDTEKLRNMRN